MDYKNGTENEESGKLPDQKELEKELSEYLSKKYGNRIKIISPFLFPKAQERNGIDDDQNGFADDFYGWNFSLDGREGPDIRDRLGHGTHVSGIIAAVGNNKRGILGVAYEKQDEGSSDASLRSVTEDTFFDITNGARGAGPAMSELARDMLERQSVTEELIALLRVQESENASRNPHAHLRKKLTAEEVMNSRHLIPPLRFLHMCPTSVGACAVIVAPEQYAKKICPNPAWVVDWVTVHGGIQPPLGHLGDKLAKSELGPLWAFGVEQASLKLYKKCNISNPRKELDVIEVYNMSTWHEAEWYERMHLCERNQAGKLIEQAATALRGDIPVNPSGGVVATNAIGASAMQRMAEAAIQVRNEGGERQVEDVKTAMAVTAGGDSYSAAALFSKSLS